MRGGEALLSSLCRYLISPSYISEVFSPQDLQSGWLLTAPGLSDHTARRPHM